MKKIIYLSFLLKIDATDVNCLASQGPTQFGKLFYLENTLASCKSLLEKTHIIEGKGATNVVLTNCEETDHTGTDAEKDIDCLIDNGLAPSDNCPPPPTGCTGSKSAVDDGVRSYRCHYECSEQSLACSPGFTNKIEMTTSFFCFDKSYHLCELETEIEEDDQIDQIIKTCREENCGYDAADEHGSIKITFDKLSVTSTYTTTSRGAGNVFNCDAGETPNGCECSHTATDATTSMSCKAQAYTNQCSNLSQFCRDNKCYNGEPIMEYKYDNCEIEDNNINFCIEDDKVYLPCGDYKHQCDEKDSTKIFDCTCFEMNESSCKAVGGVIKPSTTSECLIEGIDSNKEMMKCEEMNCFNSTFFEEDCVKNNNFASTHWQCYDNFEFFEVTNPNAAGGYNNAKKKDGSFQNLMECVEKIWLDGFYTCADTAASKSAKYCEDYGEYYVETRPEKREPSDNTPALFEFKCLSFSSEFNAVNYINDDLAKRSQCYELEVNDELVTCPDIAGCSTEAKKIDTLPEHGFYECKCEPECNYKCSSSKYDPVFPANFTEEQQKNREFTTYECEKDNLVMIICTSIFVPLGVAGIAAGVYFFFFHESSEVAPVETDNELASTRTSEHNQVDEDKKQTQSEITKDT